MCKYKKGKCAIITVCISFHSNKMCIGEGRKEQFPLWWKFPGGIVCLKSCNGNNKVFGMQVRLHRATQLTTFLIDVGQPRLLGAPPLKCLVTFSPRLSKHAPQYSIPSRISLLTFTIQHEDTCSYQVLGKQTSWFLLWCCVTKATLLSTSTITKFHFISLYFCSVVTFTARNLYVILLPLEGWPPPSLIVCSS